MEAPIRYARSGDVHIATAFSATGRVTSCCSLAPSRTSSSCGRNDQASLQRFARIERAAASPGSILTLIRANYEIDVRHLLPAIRVATLILHRAGDELVPIRAGRY
jgi:hypothetical protein